MNVLIVDDEMLMRTSLQLYLEDNHIPADCIYQAGSSSAMLSILENTKIDLAFVDIRMPGLDGLAAIEKSSSLQLETHFYILTGYSEFEYAHRALKLHIEDYLLKPVSPAQIRDILQKEKKYLQTRFLQKQHTCQHVLKQLLNEQASRTLTLPAALVCFSGKMPEKEFRQLTTYISMLLERSCRARFVKCSFLCWEYFIFQQPFDFEELSEQLNNRILHQPCSLLLKSGTNDIGITMQTVYAESLQMIFAPLHHCYRSVCEFQNFKKAGHCFAKLLHWSAEKNYDQFCLTARQLVAQLNQTKGFRDSRVFSQFASVTGFFFSNSSTNIRNPEDISNLLNVYAANNILCSTAQDNNITSIQQYIDAHYQEKITLPMLAQYFGYTPNYISTAFRKQIGVTVIQYLNQIRLSNACKLLTETGMTVQEIAESVGYSDSNYFARMFTQEYKCSPTAYRKNSQNSIFYATFT